MAGQSYRNLEILLIDDGSPDECPRICDAWAKRDDRIRVIHRENEGLGSARNLGLALAKGAYLCFVDSDDFLEKDAVEEARKQSADVVVFGFSDVDIRGKLLETFVPKPEKYRFSGEKVREEFLPLFLRGSRKTGLFPGVCWCLFSMELIRKADWRFPSEREVICEDIYALLELFRHVESVEILPKALYCYRKMEDTLSRGYRADRFDKGKVFYEKCRELCENEGFPREIREACGEPFLGLAIAAMKQEKGARLTEMIEDPVFQEALTDGKAEGWKKKLLYWAMRRKLRFLSEMLLAVRKRWK